MRQGRPGSRHSDLRSRSLGGRKAAIFELEVRWGADPALAARHAADLVALGAELLVGEANAYQALRRQTHTIPIVFVGVTDPIG